MKILALILLPCLCASAATPDVVKLIEAALAAPPEFSADALIRLAGTDKIDRARKVELLDLAFRRSGEAQEHYRRRAAPLKLDGSANYWNRVYRQDLDTLSLRLRAVEALLPLDAAKAREWFLRIPSPDPPRLTCDQFLVYDVSRFYDVLGEIGRKGEEYALLSRYTGAVKSAVALAPMAKVIAASAVSDEEFSKLLASFAGAMGKVAGDDRSFSYSTGLGKDIQALVEIAKKRKVTPLPLIEGYRLYLVVNFSGARCEDSNLGDNTQQAFGIYTGQPTDPVAANFVAIFNEKIRMAPLPPIQEAEVTPSKVAGVVEPGRFCDGEECKQFVEQFRGLVFGANGMPLPPAERNTPEWQGRLKARLESLEAWKDPGGANSRQYFREKSGAYSELLNLAQNGSNRELVLKAWLDFVKGNPLQKANRMEWLLPVNALVGRVGLDRAGLSRFAEELDRVDDPVIRLYAALEVVAPRGPDQILPLL